VTGTVTLFRGSHSGLSPSQLITGAGVSTADILISRYGSTILPVAAERSD